jgi:adenylate cyclase
MAKEIERKFLVTGDAWRTGECSDYRQGYLSIDKQRTVRIRVAGDTAFLTVKGITEGATRAEYEYSIPVTDAQAMLETLCLRPLIEKRRYRIQYNGMTWEIDEFLGENAGLVVAEIELETAQLHRIPVVHCARNFCTGRRRDCRNPMSLRQCCDRRFAPNPATTALPASSSGWLNWRLRTIGLPLTLII